MHLCSHTVKFLWQMKMYDVFLLVHDIHIRARYSTIRLRARRINGGFLLPKEVIHLEKIRQKILIQKIPRVSNCVCLLLPSTTANYSKISSLEDRFIVNT